MRRGTTVRNPGLAVTLCALAISASCAHDGTDHRVDVAGSALTEFDPIVETSRLGTLPGHVTVTDDGLFAYSVPIEVPPGRQGMQPQLAIAYTSRPSESALGVGFSLSGLSAIARCERTFAQDDERRGIELLPTDRFCLDGQRLVAEVPASYGAHGSRYRPESDPTLQVRQTSTAEGGLEGPTGFVLHLANGRTRHYGTSVDSRVVVPNAAGDSVVETWLLTEDRDPSGNYVRYLYEHLAPNLPSGWEENDPPIAVVDLVRISQIEYTGHRGATGSVAGDRLVHFLYRDHARHPSAGDCWGGTALCGPALHVEDGFRHGVYRWSATSFPLEVVQTFVQGSLVREYRLTGDEDPVTHRYQLSAVQVCANAPPANPEFDLALDPAGELVCMEPTRFQWARRPVLDRDHPDDGAVDPAYAEATFQRWEIPIQRAALPGSYVCGTTHSGEPLRCSLTNPIGALDLNGDGADDLVYYGEDGIEVRYGAGGSRTAQTLTAAQVPFQSQHIASVNGVPAGGSVSLSSPVIARGAMRPIDWNLDGRDDLLALVDVSPDPGPQWQLGVLESDGTNFDVVLGILDPDVKFYGGTTGLSEDYIYGMELLDVNGDGRQDLLACQVDLPCQITNFWPSLYDDEFEACEGRWVYALRDGDSFGPLVNTGVETVCSWEYGESIVNNYDWEHGPDVPAYRRRPVRGDFDGDGAEDLLIADRFEMPGSLRLLRWNAAYGLLELIEDVLPPGDWTPVDLNGDGLQDLVMSHYIPGTAGCSDAPEAHESCGLRAISTGQRGRFVVEQLNPYMPVAWSPTGVTEWARRMRTVSRPTNATRLRSPLPLLGFDMNGDGRGDLLSPTLADGTEHIVREREDLLGIWYRWNDEDVWAIESLTSTDYVSYPTTAVLDGPRRVYIGGGVNLNYWQPETLVLDGDGDGALDLLQAVRRISEYTIDQPPLAFLHNVRAQPALVTEVTNGLGERIEVDYGTLSDPSIYTPGTDCQYPQRCVTSSQLVVSAVRRDAGGSALAETRYAYEDGRVDLRGRGWIGFARVTSTDLSSGLVRQTFSDVQRRDSETGAYPTAHMPHIVRSWRSARDGSTVGSVSLSGTETRRTYAVVHPIPGVVQVLTVEAREREYQSMTPVPAGTIDPFVGISAIRDVLTTYEDFDAMGFAETVTRVDADVTASIEREWQHDLDLWRIGFLDLQDSSATNGLSGCDRNVRIDMVNDMAGARVASVTRDPDDPLTRLHTAYAYDEYGNVETATRTSQGETRIDTVHWEPSGYFPQQIINAAGHVAEVAYEAGRGLLRVSADPAGLERRQYYDGFGRLRRVERDGHGSVEISIEVGEFDANAAYQVRTESSHEPPSIVTHDRLGRPYHTERQHAFILASSDVVYDARGRIASVSEPRQVGTSGSPSWTQLTYDDLDHIRQVRSPVGGRQISVTYEPLERRVVDAAGNQRVEVFDARGNVSQEIVPGGTAGGSSYTYCPDGALRSVTHDLGPQVVVAYDRLGRRVHMDDPNSGISTWEYGPFDELASVEDAELRETTFHYDLLGRMVRRSRHSDGQEDEFVYDETRLGALHQAISGDGVVDEFVYDEFGREQLHMRFIGGTEMRRWTYYDDVGRPSQVIYDADGLNEELTYGYSPVSGELEAMWLASHSTIWQLEAQSAHGAPSFERLGDEGRPEYGILTRESGHNAVGEIATIHTEANDVGVVQELEYEYNSVGLVSFRHDHLAGTHDEYLHDALGRIRQVLRGGVLREDYEIDELGNLESTHDATITYGSPSDPRPHAPSAIVDPYGSEDTIDYNLAGEATRVGTLTLDYTQLGLPRSAGTPWHTIAFGYDAYGQRAVRQRSSRSTLYFGEWERDTGPWGPTDRIRITGPNGAIAQIEHDGSTSRLRWLLPERLDSIEASWYPGDGAPDEYDPADHHQYDAFGNAQPSGAFGDTVRHGYTGHEHDFDLGVINMRGRWYHPRLRRFLSPDPLVSADGQGMNRYSYVRNSPFALVDPTGLTGVRGGRWVVPWEGPPVVITARRGDDAGSARSAPGPSVAGSDSGESERGGSGVAGEAVAAADAALRAADSIVTRVERTVPSWAVDPVWVATGFGHGVLGINHSPLGGGGPPEPSAAYDGGARAGATLGLSFDTQVTSTFAPILLSGLAMMPETGGASSVPAAVGAAGVTVGGLGTILHASALDRVPHPDISGVQITMNRVPRSDHARLRAAEGRPVRHVVNDIQRARDGDLFEDAGTGNLLVRGPGGREHVISPNGVLVTSLERTARAHLARLRSGRVRPATAEQREYLRSLGE